MTKIELSFIDRKIITADIRDLKRKLERESAFTFGVDYEVMLQQLMAKYYKVTSLGLSHGFMTADEANDTIMAYKSEIPKIFKAEFGL